MHIHILILHSRASWLPAHPTIPQFGVQGMLLLVFSQSHIHSLTLWLITLVVSTGQMTAGAPLFAAILADHFASYYVTESRSLVVARP